MSPALASLSNNEALENNLNTAFSGSPAARILRDMGVSSEDQKKISDVIAAQIATAANDNVEEQVRTFGKGLPAQAANDNVEGPPHATQSPTTAEASPEPTSPLAEDTANDDTAADEPSLEESVGTLANPKKTGAFTSSAGAQKKDNNANPANPEVPGGNIDQTPKESTPEVDVPDEIAKPIAQAGAGVEVNTPKNTEATNRKGQTIPQEAPIRRKKLQDPRVTAQIRRLDRDAKKKRKKIKEIEREMLPIKTARLGMNLARIVLIVLDVCLWLLAALAAITIILFIIPVAEFFAVLAMSTTEAIVAITRSMKKLDDLLKPMELEIARLSKELKEIYQQKQQLAQQRRYKKNQQT